MVARGGEPSTVSREESVGAGGTQEQGQTLLWGPCVVDAAYTPLQSRGMALIAYSMRSMAGMRGGNDHMSAVCCKRQLASCSVPPVTK